MRLPELHAVLEIPVLQVTATARAGVAAVARVAMTTSRCAHVRYHALYTTCPAVLHAIVQGHVNVTVAQSLLELGLTIAASVELFDTPHSADYWRMCPDLQ